MKLRKIIALLSAALFMLSMTSLSVSVFAEENLLTNGGFEAGNGDGWDVRSGSSVVSNVVHSGSYAIKSTNTNTQYQTMFAQKLSVNPNTDYTISYWYYYDGSCADPACYLYVMDGDKAVNVGSHKNAPEAKHTWYQVTTTFNTGIYASIWVYIKNDKVGDGGTYYFDDFVLTGPKYEPEEPEGENLLTNGDFEAGNTGGWTVYQGTTATAAAAKSGSYGAHLTGNGGWGSMINQRFATKKGFRYTLSFDLKAVNNGTNIQVKDDQTSDILYTAWKTNTYWDTITVQFTAMSERTFLNFCGGGNGLAESVYLDNVWISEIPREHEYDDIQDTDCNICGEKREVSVNNIISGGQSSASADVKGLGFKFEIAGVGTAVDGNNKYVTGSAVIKPLNETEYKLIRMGAVMSNKADADLNLNSVNGKSIINVEAVYLLESDEDSLTFSTRIVDIPEAGQNTNIYACPYYVFEKDGETIVLYGEIASQNYAAAIGA